jgi:hypothetical protein
MPCSKRVPLPFLFWELRWRPLFVSTHRVTTEMGDVAAHISHAQGSTDARWRPSRMDLQ